MRFRAFAFFSIAILLTLAAPLIAHHSMSMFDPDKQATYAGVVTKFNFTNPHIYIFLNVKRNGGTEPMRSRDQAPYN